MLWWLWRCNSGVENLYAASVKGGGGGEASVRASMDNSGSHDLWACRRLWSRPIHVGIECSRRAGGARSRPL